MPNYTNSDIFNSYIKISNEKGLVSLAEDSNDSKKALDKNPRADSLSQERIGELYGVKCDIPKDLQYKRNIIERAHPEVHVIGPAYDKINALVENNNQQQDISLHIVNKRTNGLLTNHKYAQDDMTRFLVSIANDMDNRNEDELRILADECLESLKKKANILDLFTSGSIPNMFRPLASAMRADTLTVPIAAILAAVGLVPLSSAITVGTSAGLIIGPLLSYLMGMDASIGEVYNDCEIAINAIDNVLTKSTFNFGIVDQKPNIDALIDLKNIILNLKNATLKFRTNIQSIGQNKDIAYNKGASIQNIKTLIDSYNNLLNRVKDLHENINKDYNENINETLVRLKEWFTPMVRQINPVENMYSALATLSNSIAAFQKTYEFHSSNVKSKAQEYFGDAAAAPVDDLFATKPAAATPPPAGNTQPSNDNDLFSGFGEEPESAAAKAAYFKGLVSIIKK